MMAKEPPVTIRRGFACVAAVVVVSLAWFAPGRVGAQSAGPDVEGMDLRAAVAELEAWDPEVRVAIVPDPLPADLDWGTATVDRQVRVPVEGGTEVELRARAVVPWVVDMATGDALAVLASHGLAANAKLYGTVREQSLDRGEVVPFGVVLSLRSVTADVAGATPFVEVVEVPDVLGRPLDDARAAFLEAGLEPSERLRGLGEPGPVVDQEPPAGTRVARGTVAVAIAEAAAPPPVLVVVPDVRASSVGDASARLDDLGLGFELRVDSPVSYDEPSDVRRQEPDAGTEVEEGTVVVVFAEPMVYVPDLADLDEGAARGVLGDRGLELVYEVKGDGDGPRVREQRPLAGDLVAVGTEVRAVAVPTGPTPSVQPTAPPGGDDGSPWVWVGLAAAGAAVLIAVTTVLTWRQASRRRQVRRLREHVRVAAVDVAGEPAVDEAVGPDRSHSIRLEPHEVAPAQTVEEVVR